MRSESEFAYIARKECGCVVGAIVDSADDKREVARWVAGWIKSGFAVERVTNEYVRQNITFKCPHEKPKAKSQQPSLWSDENE